MGRRKWKQYQDSTAQSHATDLLAKQSPSIGKRSFDNSHKYDFNSFFLSKLESEEEDEEEQETNNKLKENEKTKTGIKAEAADIKEETKLMTVEDVSEKLGTMTRYCKTVAILILTFPIKNLTLQKEKKTRRRTSNQRVNRHHHHPIHLSRSIGSLKTSVTFASTANC